VPQGLSAFPHVRRERPQTRVQAARPTRRAGPERRPQEEFAASVALRPVPPLAAEWRLAGDPDRPAGPGRCGRVRSLWDVECRSQTVTVLITATFANTRVKWLMLGELALTVAVTQMDMLS
jgi:hypothetical protein